MSKSPERQGAGTDEVSADSFASRVILNALGEDSVLSQRVIRLMGAARAADEIRDEVADAVASLVKHAVDGTLRALSRVHNARSWGRTDLVEIALRTVEELGVAPATTQEIITAVRERALGSLTDRKPNSPQNPLQ